MAVMYSSGGLQSLLPAENPAASLQDARACDIVAAPTRRLRIGLIAAGAAALAYAATLTVISDVHNNGDIDMETTRWLMVTASIVAGAVYLVGLVKTQKRAPRRSDFLVILLVGLTARLMLVSAPPVFVSDLYRYLLDGAVTASAMNPYQFTPEAVLAALNDTAPASRNGVPEDRGSAGAIGAHAVPARLVELGREGGGNLYRINHPHLATIYPPTAQTAFAIAYWIKPWSVGALRCVLLGFDLATLLLLVVLLRLMTLPMHWLTWYWWNPLLLREISHSAHMDVVVLPFVLLGLLFVIKKWHFSAGTALAVAVGAKVWPLVLLPILVRAASRRRRDILFVVGAFVAVSALVWMPVMRWALNESSGFYAYASSWYNNTAVFHVIRWSIGHVLRMVSIDSGHAPAISRLVVGCLVLGFAITQSRRSITTANDLVRRSMLIVAVLFLLSPTQFPWYYVWLLPLLAVAPRNSLLLYTCLLPLYYFHYQYPWLVWVQHLPVLGWFAVEEWTSRRRMRMTENREMAA